MREPTDTILDFRLSEGAPLAVIECAEGSFVFEGSGELRTDEIRPFDSSGDRKWPYRGTFYSQRGIEGEGTPAVALFYSPDNRLAFGRESAALSQGTLLGVGPRLFAIGVGIPPGISEGRICNVVIEEDVGISLADALQGAAIPGRPRASLDSDPASPAGSKQTAKLLFDIASQLFRLHSHGLRHGDVKSSNICVKSTGPRPWDVRATLVDMELTAEGGDIGFLGHTDLYYKTLFFDKPTVEVPHPEPAPTSLEYDLGCLALVRCEVMCRKPLEDIGRAELARILADGGACFGYDEEGRVRIAQIDRTMHLAPLAMAAGLRRACEYPELQASSARWPLWLTARDFVDGKDLSDMRNASMVKFAERQDRIARALFANYNEHLAADGETPKYEDFDALPQTLLDSNYAQAADIVQKIERLGYDLVEFGACSGIERVEEFSGSQVEMLARWEHERWVEERLSQGWRLGETEDGRGDPERKISPYLIGYDELDDSIKEYDRQPMREIIRVLEDAGFAIVKKR